MIKSLWKAEHINNCNLKKIYKLFYIKVLYNVSVDASSAGLFLITSFSYDKIYDFVQDSIKAF